MLYANHLWCSEKFTTILSKWRSSDKLTLDRDRFLDFITDVGATILIAFGLLVGILALWVWIVFISIVTLLFMLDFLP
jgi:hypothetical protein